MGLLDQKNRKTILVIGILIVFFIIALWLRLVPLFSAGAADPLTMVASDDPIYNLRQVEQLLANFPAYAWFDAMSQYPAGTSIYWGPLFTFLLAFACLITGAATRPEIISTTLLVGPVLGAAMVPVMYFFGKWMDDWKTGIFAAGFTAIVTGQFYFRSYYGYIDHHIAEVFFATIFSMLYVYALIVAKDTPVDLKKTETFKKILFISTLAGIAYFLGLLVMPTMILFALIAGFFTVVQFVIDVFRDRSGLYLLLINTVVFSVAGIGLVLFGFKDPGVSLSTYSIGHIYAYIALVAGTCALYFIARYLKGRPAYYYPVAIAGCAAGGAAVLWLFNPQVYNLLVSSMFAFFGQYAVTDTVLEARGWSPDAAWIVFNYGFILMAGGALVLIYRNMRDEHPEQIFVLVWSLVMLVATWQHVRYEYYLAINIVLLAAICMGYACERGGKDLFRFTASRIKATPKEDVTDANRDEGKKGKKQKKDLKTDAQFHSKNYLPAAMLVIAIGVAALFVWSSVSVSYSEASSVHLRMNGDWKESLEWMGNNTPDSGVSYLEIYDQTAFTYPNESYGVMSWWDYGHMITYIAQRIPNANPFQAGVAGPNGSAAYFTSTDEGKANAILDALNTRYIITDIEMDDGKFPAIATWNDPANGYTIAPPPYRMELFIPQDTSTDRLASAVFSAQPYYLTMVSRLHNFDGSHTSPSAVYYLEYADPAITGTPLPVVTAGDLMNATTATSQAEAFNRDAKPGYHAAVFGRSLVEPADTVPALRHYRLVHESPTNVYRNGTPDVRYVKVFEYVPGARIRGEGMIEVPVKTNTGREFVYRQESINGEFVVPYATSGSSGEVVATGKYRIIATGHEYDVPESAVMQGTEIR